MPRRKCSNVPLCDYADPLIKDLGQLLPAALRRFDEDAIHEARVSTRRLRAALDLVEPMVSSKATIPLRKTLKRLRRRLGPLRDLDVMISHLSPLRNQRHPEAASWLIARFEEARRKERRKAGRKKTHPEKWAARLGAWDALRLEVRGLGEEVEARMRSSMLEQWAAFAAQAELLSTALLNERVEAPPDGPPSAGGLSSDLRGADPHALRIAGKLLRYTLEMLGGTSDPPTPVVKRVFKRMQNELGLWHDHVVLAERAMQASLEGELALHDPALQARVLELVTSVLRRAEQRLKRFARLWRERGPALSRLVQPRETSMHVSDPPQDLKVAEANSPNPETPSQDAAEVA